MLSKEQVLQLIQDLESDRIEYTESFTKTNKFSEAICAFSNDMPGHNLPGYLLIGVRDNGKLSGLKVTDQLLQNLASLRDNGKIQPIPTMNVFSYSFPEGDIAIVEVFPSDMPPVRYDGKVHIRIGPRRAIATIQEEKKLSERRINQTKHFDVYPCKESSLSDLLVELFLFTYLPKAVDPQVIADNHRELTLKLASLRFYDLRQNYPTYAGILLFAKDPLYWLPNAYVQFLRIQGSMLTDPIIDEKEITGDLLTVLKELDSLLNLHIKQHRKFDTVLHEEIIVDYPKLAIRELLMNAVMHRDYQISSPIRFYWFEDHIEIQSPGGLYDGVTPENFTRMNIYRNPTIAEAMKNLGYVNRYGLGISEARKSLMANHNLPPEFACSDMYVLVKIWART